MKMWEEILPIWLEDINARLATCWRELDLLSGELDKIDLRLAREDMNLLDQAKLNRLSTLVDLINAEVERLVLCKLDAKLFDQTRLSGLE